MACARKEKQARAGEETYGESNCCGEDFRKVFEATAYIKKYGGGGWRVIGVRKRPPKCFQLIHFGCEKLNQLRSHKRERRAPVRWNGAHYNSMF